MNKKKGEVEEKSVWNLMGNWNQSFGSAEGQRSIHGKHSIFAE